MSAKLNLASRPFRNRALPWTVTALVAIASFAALSAHRSVNFYYQGKD